MRREYRERFLRHRRERKLLVSDPGIHHVTRVPYCMSGSLTRDGLENVPGIPGACATRNCTYHSYNCWTESPEDPMACVYRPSANLWAASFADLTIYFILPTASLKIYWHLSSNSSTLPSKNNKNMPASTLWSWCLHTAIHMFSKTNVITKVITNVSHLRDSLFFGGYPNEGRVLRFLDLIGITNIQNMTLWHLWTNDKLSPRIRCFWLLRFFAFYQWISVAMKGYFQR